MTNNEIKLKTEKWRYSDDDGNYVDFREEVERLLVSTTYLGTSPAALHAEWILAAGICSHARLIMRTTSCLVIGSQLPSSSVWPTFHAFQMARKRDLNDRMTSTSRGCTTDVQPPGTYWTSTPIPSTASATAWWTCAGYRSMTKWNGRPLAYGRRTSSTQVVIVPTLAQPVLLATIWNAQ